MGEERQHALPPLRLKQGVPPPIGTAAVSAAGTVRGGGIWTGAVAAGAATVRGMGWWWWMLLLVVFCWWGERGGGEEGVLRLDGRLEERGPAKTKEKEGERSMVWRLFVCPIINQWTRTRSGKDSSRQLHEPYAPDQPPPLLGMALAHAPKRGEAQLQPKPPVLLLPLFPLRLHWWWRLLLLLLLLACVYSRFMSAQHTDRPPKHPPTD